MALVKKRFVGVFNFNRMRYVEYAYAHSKHQAFVVLCRRIAKKQSVIPSMVINYFMGKENSYDITEE